MMELWVIPVNIVHSNKEQYKNQTEKHNKKVVAHQQGKEYADSGFDLYVPWNPEHSEGKWIFPPHTTIKIPLGIKIVNRVSDRSSGYSLPIASAPFYIYARSSISKTPLRLANNQGIIDSGYRGELMIALDNIIPKQWELNPGTRLVQVCAPNLVPFKVHIVNQDFETTERGSGGFGSTGT